ncbi:MAG: HlyD family efflux transporter periplasmic adaptor subunit [Anaerolineales bacterium]|nr:MAG: HlyD family efflux transporter periplasmic adaptor subunit [Anaerolineales bacterium]
MKKWMMGLVVLGVVAGGAFLVWGDKLTQVLASDATPEAETILPAVEAPRQVIAEAKVVPVQYAALSLPVGGIVTEVSVGEGDSVQAGQLLLRVEAAQQVAAVAQAEAGLQNAQAQLDELKAGPRPQEIKAAQAAVQVAQAQLARVTQAARPEEVNAAQAGLASAQAALDKVLEGPDPDEISLAAAGLRRAEIALQQAQWAYDQVAYGADVGVSPQAAHLQQATLDYETALASYHLAVRGPTQAELAAARAQLAQAESNLALLLQGASQAELAEAEAEIHRAQAQLELVQAGARPQAIVAAEADVAAAQATLAQARAALAQTELRAPFAGSVAGLDARPGEQVTPGTPVLQLADFSAWQIETDDLTELSVVEISQGAAVTITLDAIPELELPGQVLRVKAIGENKQGDITYTVLIQPDRQDPRLRWNMTTAVFIQPTSADQRAAGAAQARTDLDGRSE